jgi:hypothetical protein
MPAEDKRPYEEKAASVLGLSLWPGVAHTPVAHRVKDWTKEQVAKFVQEGWSTEEDRAKGRAYAASMLAEDIDGEGTSSPTSHPTSHPTSYPTSVPNPLTLNHLAGRGHGLLFASAETAPVVGFFWL